jgi:hypothetical protein
MRLSTGATMAPNGPITGPGAAGRRPLLYRPETRMKIDFWNGGYIQNRQHRPSLFQDLDTWCVGLPFRSGRIFYRQVQCCGRWAQKPAVQQVALFADAAGAESPWSRRGPHPEPAPATVPAGWRIDDLTGRGLLGDIAPTVCQRKPASPSAGRSIPIHPQPPAHNSRRSGFPVRNPTLAGAAQTRMNIKIQN